jgi:predicted ATP-grasp superfamily ATP-dependent carboligase
MGGGMDLVRPLGLAGIRCAVVTQPGSPSVHSRFTQAALYWNDFSEGTEKLVEALVRFGAAQSEPPVLFYTEDAHLLLVSRYRRRLKTAFRFVLADEQLIEDLVDKGRFQALAERLHLPVPATQRIRTAEGSSPPPLDLRFPIIIKPPTRDDDWGAAWGKRKALQVDTPAAMAELWPRLAASGTDLLAQELIPGAESRIESYHVYVDEQGTIVGEFTGRKIRTQPSVFGFSTALETTAQADVTNEGRALVRRLNLRGVAKVDFKRGPDDRLHLLEINPRFNLWHHLGAVAGVNLPALVYADALGQPRPAMRAARAGVRWCLLWHDVLVAGETGIPLAVWLPWALRCEAKSAVAWDDPLPLLRGIWSLLWSRLRAAFAAESIVGTALIWFRTRVARTRPQPAREA